MLPNQNTVFLAGDIHLGFFWSLMFVYNYQNSTFFFFLLGSSVFAIDSKMLKFCISEMWSYHIVTIVIYYYQDTQGYIDSVYYNYQLCYKTTRIAFFVYDFLCPNLNWYTLSPFRDRKNMFCVFGGWEVNVLTLVIELVPRTFL